ncbi:glycoside hydrolase family 6 protein [Curtobacterium sp. ISL-83]|uniref:glycoside hydrolase family 6 protein n=1 Tax=Curtobacterium sp. ISL-83 TaxID=2819145 RepID=UPI001BE84F82|nr:glycoside hydrolase family 6 protein [Curtobacterium sp. ISL-83]MBT2503880.1 glycoside hydrolase family 6 protein [Curtobacterium sp. ISL-83]
MTNRFLRQSCVALVAVAALALPLASVTSANASVTNPLPAGTHFYTPPIAGGSGTQILQLAKKGDLKDAALIGKEVTTPSAVWFTSGTPRQVQQQVRQTALRARVTRTVPTMVAYNVPGRDCSQYSSGGASSDAAYTAWADGFAQGLTGDQKVIVIVEPDGLANLPADCPSAYTNPGTYPNPAPGTATAGRIADIKYAGQAITKADPNALVYLDAGHNAWHNVGDITRRLQDAGLADVQGMSLNTSNYQWTPDLSQYGTWISDCDAYTTTVKPGDYASCGDQYWSGGPANAFAGVALDPSLQWSDTATNPAANTAGINSRYASELGSVAPSAHFVLDTSRNGTGPWTAPAGKYSGDAQTWCNPPGAGLGARPQAEPQPTAFPMLDAYLWIKTPGQSDGQCNRSVAGSTTDPEWGGITDPAAGAWFPQQALQLAQNAVPALTSTGEPEWHHSGR